MADEPFILPTFTFDTFRKNRLSATSHVVGTGKSQVSTDDMNTSTSSATLMDQLKDEGIEIDSPYEAFFTDGAPPESSQK